MKLVHYTDNENFEVHPVTIKNEMWIKPLGGIWCSPAVTEWGWKEWCKESEFYCAKHPVQIQISTKNLYVIDSFDDLDKLPVSAKEIPLPFDVLDFEQIKKTGIDAIHLTIKGEQETRHSRPKWLYGWDCESVLILNERCIEKVET